MFIFAKMNNESEINALLMLIDDPDDYVFESVSNKLISYGLPVIPLLEDVWENTENNDVQLKIEILIHKIHFANLYKDFENWNESGHHELLPALLLVSKLLYPELQAGKVIQNLERLKRNIWLELNNYLTPIEQVNVVNSILYNYFNLKGGLNNSDTPNEFLLSHIIETKKGNQTGIGALYLLIAEMLDIPVKFVAIPQQFVLAYFKRLDPKEIEKLHLNIEFFIEPATGQMFTHNDLNNYFNRMGINVKPDLFKARDNKTVIIKVLTDLQKCFTNTEKDYIHHEINQLIRLLQNS